MTKRKAEFQEGRGYTRADWDEVSDSPELTPEMMAQAKPFAEACPELAASIKRGKGRPRVAEPLQAVTLRLPPDTIAWFKAQGSDWRARMVKVLQDADI